MKENFDQYWLLDKAIYKNLSNEKFDLHIDQICYI